MSELSLKEKRQRIQRLIRDLNIRYIKGSINRRMYQTLKTKYEQMLDDIPSINELGKIDEKKDYKTDSIQKAEEDIQQISTESEVKIDEPSKFVLPIMNIENIPSVEREELKIRYVMHLALKASAKTFEEEIEYEKEYLSGKLSNQEYLDKKNLIETKQHKIFQHYYKLSDALFNLSKEHIFKRTHNNFLLFTNELSENLNRLRAKEMDKYEVKGIIYEINNIVLRHRPILKKAFDEINKWIEVIRNEKKRFSDFLEEHQISLTETDVQNLERKIKQLSIYEELLEEDLKDYETDLEAIDEIYGEHLRYQEIISPYFEELSDEVRTKIRKYNENIRSLLFKNQVLISSDVISQNMDYKILSELSTLWNYAGRPVLNENDNLIGFVIGPGKMDDKFGAIIWQQTEISLQMARRIYDHVVAPIKFGRDLESDEKKREELLNEIPISLPFISFNYLIPDVIIKYCDKLEASLSDELLKYLKQSTKHLFVPIEDIKKESREIVIKTNALSVKGSIIPNFNLKKSNEVSKVILENSKVLVKNLFGDTIGTAHSVISHPRKGHFVIVKKIALADEMLARLYDMIYDKDSQEESDSSASGISEKKWRFLLNLSREYRISESDASKSKFLKKILIEKNTGILPENIENANYVLYSMGNIRTIGNNLQITYAAPSFELGEVFDIEGKVVENIKGTDIGVVYTLQLETTPSILIWSKIDLLLIASFISDDPLSVFKRDKHFIDNLAIAIGNHLSLAPQVALRPDNVITFMNLIGKINSLNQIKDITKKFDPTIIELSRIISIDEHKILVDITDEEIIQERRREEALQTVDDESEEEQFVTSPDYYLKNQTD